MTSTNTTPDGGKMGEKEKKIQKKVQKELKYTNNKHFS